MLLSVWERERKGRVTLDELRQALGPSTARSIIAGLVRKGLLERIAPGVYLIHAFRSLARPHRISSAVAAAALLADEPYYLGGWWALSQHRLSQQVYASLLDAYTTRERRSRTLGPARVAFHVLPASAFSYGIEPVTLEGAEVRVSDVERTVLDALDYPRAFGGVREALRVIGPALAGADQERLIAYAARGSRPGTCQRLGVLLGRLGATPRATEPLARRVRETASLLSMLPDAPRTGTVDATWRVVENDIAEGDFFRVDPLHAGPDKTTRRSMLQLKILRRLAEEPVESISKLAESLDAHRPSVSRSLRSLEGEGLVYHDHGAWHLTEDGEFEAAAVSDKLIETLERVGATAKRVLEGFPRVEIPTAIIEAARSLTFPSAAFAAGQAPPDFGALSPMAEAVRAITAQEGSSFADQVADVVKQTDPGVGARESVARVGYDPTRAGRVDRELSKKFSVMGTLGSMDPHAHGVTSGLVRDAAGGIGEARGIGAALAAAVDTQRSQLDWIEAMPRSTLSALSQVVSQNMVPTSQLVADLAAMYGAAGASEALDGHAIGSIARAAAEVVTAHRDYMKDTLTTLADTVGSRPEREIAGPRLEVHELAGSTYATSWFVSGARALVATDEHEPGGGPRGDVTMARERAASIEDALAELGPRFLAMWHGAWSTLNADGPDATRQAAHSARELLTQGLEALAPDSHVAGQQKVTRQMRVTWIVGPLSKSRLDWANSMFKSVDGAYGLLSGGAHWRGDEPRFGREALVAMLEALGALLRFLIDCRKQRGDGQPS